MSTPPDLSSLRIERDRPASPRAGGGRRAWPWVAGALVVLAALAAYAVRPRATVVTATAPVVTGGALAGGAGITANGYVVARTKASVSAKIPGRLAYLGVAEGSHVRRGEIIARIESADQRAAVRSAEAQLMQQRAERDQTARDLARAEALARAQVLSPADVENARTKMHVLDAQVAAARAQLEAARVSLENTNVRAPFDGTVLRKDAELGEMVVPASAGGGLTATAIATMADLATLEVEVDVNEAYIAQVAHGEAARITLDAYPDTSFQGVVRQVVPTADRQKGTVLVKVAILDHDPRILPEMGAKVEFVRGAGAQGVTLPRRVTVPKDAVVGEGAGTRVWVIAGDRVHARAVTLGPARDDQLEVRAGLTGDERLVDKPSATLKDGQRVRVATPAS
ncbi:MAG TPA: efflux RND transporter periplasmic adaptor subunit [Candidatus Eisenbacteria bacterium]|nr:efflux RND transporter periplasmic adaptor subunit [Candidatus Eisenbacteria bacterium]